MRLQACLYIIHHFVLFPNCRIIQNFIMREQSGALAPPSYDVHKARHSRKGGIMATVISGKPSRSTPTMSIELSLEMNRKMQSVLEDTLLKNITLKVCVPYSEKLLLVQIGGR